MDQIGVPPIGVEPISGGVSRSVPVVAITSVVALSGMATVTWSFESDTSRPQHSFRISLLTSAGDLLYGTGDLLVSAYADVDSTSGSFTVPYLLSTGSYQVEVFAADAFDGSLPALQVFTAELSSVSNTPIVETVGSVFDVAVAGVGHIVADRLPDRPLRRTTAALQGPRFTTGDTPFNQAIDRYSYSTQIDWSGGAGQRVANRSRSTAERFYRSEGIDPFEEPNRLRLLPAVDSRLTGTDGGVFLATAGSAFVAVHKDDGSAVVWPSGWSSAVSTTLASGAQECNGLAGDGKDAYAALDNEINRYNGSWAKFGPTYAGSQFTDIAWTADRLTVGYTNSSSEACLSTVGPSGSEEVSGGRFKFQDSSISGITAGDGYIWFGVNKGFQGSVFAWQNGSAESRFQAMELPTDQVVESLFFYLGNVMVGARDSTGTMYIYRAIPSAGTLTPSLLLKLDDQDGKHRVDFTARGSLVFFTWSSMNTGKSGIGAIDLTTSGHCSWLAGLVTVNNTGSFSVANFNEVLTFSVVTPAGGSTVYSESSLTLGSGWIESSVDDSASALPKVFDEFVLRTEAFANPLDSVTIELSVNSGQSYSEIGRMSGAGSTFAEFPVDLSGQSFITKVTLRSQDWTPPGGSTVTSDGPEVRLLQMKLHPLTISDEVVELPLDLGPNRVGLNGRSLANDFTPMFLLRTLQSLVGTRVKFQDVDWPSTRKDGVWEVTGVQATSAGSFSRHKGGRVEHDAVAVVTLRRAQ